MDRELRRISKALKRLKEMGIIRTNNLVGDLGEYYCQLYFKIKLNNVVEKGFDGYDDNKEKVEIKTRRSPIPNAKVIFKGFDFDYCIYVELNDFYEPVLFLKIKSSEIAIHTDSCGDRLSVRKLKSIKNKEKLNYQYNL